MKDRFKYWQWRVIICSMIGYVMFYFVRKNFSFAIPLLSEEYGITNAIGLTMCVVTSVVLGFSDKISMAVTGCAEGSSFIRGMIIVMAICYIVNHIFQGCGFAPCNHLMVSWVLLISQRKKLLPRRLALDIHRDGGYCNCRHTAHGQLVEYI